PPVSPVLPPDSQNGECGQCGQSCAPASPGVRGSVTAPVGVPAPVCFVPGRDRSRTITPKTGTVTSTRTNRSSTSLLPRTSRAFSSAAPRRPGLAPWSGGPHPVRARLAGVEFDQPARGTPRSREGAARVGGDLDPEGPDPDLLV